MSSKKQETKTHETGPEKNRIADARFSTRDFWIRARRRGHPPECIQSRGTSAEERIFDYSCGTWILGRASRNRRYGAPIQKSEGQQSFRKREPFRRIPQLRCASRGT